MISYAAAVLFSLSIEYPFAALEKLMFRSKQHEAEEDKSHGSVTKVTN